MRRATQAGYDIEGTEKAVMNDLRQTLHTALVTQFRVDRDGLDDNTGLFSSGLIDSLSVMDLVCFVEHEIGRAVPPTAITLENFDSIARIVAFARTLTGAEKDA
jgi:D-alanine--poly(phosphoribitol) ligase subunit 2